MYGQMTAGSWIYIGTQGILQGTFETFAAVARRRFDGSLRGRARADRRLRRHGRRAAAGRVDARRRLPRGRRRPHRLERRVESRYLDLVAPDLDAALREAEEARAAGDGRSIGIVGSAGEVFRALLERGVAPRHRHRPDERARSARRLRPRRALARRCRRAARERPAGATSSARAPRWPPTAPPWSSSRSAGRRSSTTATACAPRPARAASTGPSRTRASSRRTCGRSSAPARARSAGRRSRATRTTSRPPTPRSARSSPRTQHLQRWLELARDADRVPGPAGAHLLAGLRRAPPRRPALQRARAPRRGQRADRDRPRPPRLRLRRLALPRDRGDDGRLGRDRRLADPERAAGRLLGRGLGRRPPRRRRGHRALDPLRRAGRRRRHGRRRAARSSACSRTTRARA